MPVRIFVLALAVAAGLFIGAGPARAIDAFVYRDCMARCKQFADRSCCHEQCSYNACIADSVKTNMGHGSRKDGFRVDQTDPGAWSAAMAACYSWISILQECSAGQPGRPPAQGEGGGGQRPAPPEHRPPPNGKVVLRRIGQPVPDAADANWVTVQSGHMVGQGYGYKGTFKWSEPPEEITVHGFPIELKVTSHSENHQRMATGIEINGDFDLLASPNGKTPATRQYPANSDASVNASDTKENGGTVYVMPRKSYGAGARVLLRVGAFWGRGVSYYYAPVAQ